MSRGINDPDITTGYGMVDQFKSSLSSLHNRFNFWELYQKINSYKTKGDPAMNNGQTELNRQKCTLKLPTPITANPRFKSRKMSYLWCSRYVRQTDRQNTRRIQFRKSDSAGFSIPTNFSIVFTVTIPTYLSTL